jgi:HPt (histidine-containing phosphotransfer) domain-containing protein
MMEEVQNFSQNARVNLPELLSRVDNDRELLCDLLTIFKEDFPRHLRALQEAVASQDLKQITIVSHTLKGMLANLAVARAATAVARLEELAHEGVGAAIQEALAAFELEVQGLLPEMETYMAEVRR